jgi:hypothetical protein
LLRARAGQAHRQFFATIAAGTKKTEYRDFQPYWQTRLEGCHYDLIHFRNGYATDAPEMLVEFAGLRRQGRGANAKYATKSAERHCRVKSCDFSRRSGAV